MGAPRLTRRFVLGGAAALLLAAPLWADDGLSRADLTLSAADGRQVKVRVTWPQHGPKHSKRRLPLLVFSHGANGTLDGLVPLQNSLTRGRIVVAPQHPDSEANPDLAKVDRKLVLAQRVADMQLVLDSLPLIERTTGRGIDSRRIAAGGHSYGALIAQMLGGAEISGRSWRDQRVSRVLAFSPPGPFPGLAEASGWSKIAVPQFVLTGTLDVVPPVAATWQAHTVSFDASPIKGSALWVGRDVDHYFGNHIQRLSRAAADQSAAFRQATDLADAFLRGAPLRAVAGATTERLVLK